MSDGWLQRANPGPVCSLVCYFFLVVLDVRLTGGGIGNLAIDRRIPFCCVSAQREQGSPSVWGLGIKRGNCVAICSPNVPTF